jgi:Domain of unknown function (DUF4440)/Aspartyl protease
MHPMEQRMAGAWMRLLSMTVLVIGGLLMCPGGRCQDSLAAAGSESQDEIPIEKCDVLPVVRLKIAGSEMRFLLDTGATTILNLGSFASGGSKEIQVSSWNGTAATSAREVRLPELALGSHRLKDLRLPAIDLSPIGKACGGRVDGILGVDLLDKMGVTIDLKRQVASMAPAETDARVMYGRMEGQMHHCAEAFEQGAAKELEECFDPEIVLYTPDGEYHGRKQAVEYLQARYMKYAPNLSYKMTPHDVKMFGDALWYSYDYEITAPGTQVTGHGMSMCRKDRDGKWVVLNLHNSLKGPDMEAGVAKNR